MSRQTAENVDLGQCCPSVVGTVLSAAEAEALARVFKALADPVRLRLLSMITGAEGGEACVCDLTVGFEVSGPTISHHLKVLREAGLIEGDRRGTWIYYRTVPQALEAVSTALAPVAISARGAVLARLNVDDGARPLPRAER